MKHSLLKLSTLALFLVLSTGLSAQCGLLVFPNEVQSDCGGMSTGAVDAIGVLGTPPYTVVWQNASMTTIQTDLNVPQGVSSTVSGLSAGVYTVTFTDATGTCSTSGNATVSGGTVPTVSNTSSTGETCVLNDGTATVAPTGGSGTYTFLWDAAAGSQTTATATGLSAGSYVVTVTDAVGGCSANAAVTVADDCTGGIPTTNLQAADCGITVAHVSQIIFSNPVPGANNYEYRLENTGTGQTFFQIRGSGQNNFWMSAVGGMEYATTYNVAVRVRIGSVWGNFGNICQVTTPPDPATTTSLTGAFCGITLGSITDVVQITPVNLATNYEYRFTDTGNGSVFTRFRGNSNPNYPIGAAGLTYGRTYDVVVRPIINGMATTFGPVCQLTTPAFPSTQVRAADCGITLGSFSQVFYCDPVVGANNYQWRFTSQSDGTVLTRYRNGPATNMFMSVVPNAQPLTTYNVEVRARVGGGWGTFGTICTLTTGSNLQVQNNNFAAPAELQHAPNTPTTKTTMQIGPNPNNGQNLKVNLVAEEEYQGHAEVTVYDMNGRLMHSRQVELNNAPINLQFEQPLATGIYLVGVRFGDTLVTEKLLVR